MKFFNKIIYIFVFVIVSNGRCENYPQSEIDKDGLYRSFCLDMIKQDKVFEDALSLTKKKLYTYTEVYVNDKEKKEHKIIARYEHDQKGRKKISSDFYEIIKLEDLEVEQLNMDIKVQEENENAKIILKGNIIFKSTGINSNIKSDIDKELLPSLKSRNTLNSKNHFWDVFMELIKSKNTFSGRSVDFENEYIKKKDKFFYHGNVIEEYIPNSLLQGHVKITLEMPSKFHIANSTVNFRKQIEVGKNDGIDSYVWDKPKAQKYPGHMFLAFNFDKDYSFDITQKFDLKTSNVINGPMPFLNIDNVITKIQFLNNNDNDISGKIKSNMHQNNIYDSHKVHNHVAIEIPKDEKILKIKYNIISHIGALKSNSGEKVIDFSSNETIGKLAHNIIDECNASNECDCVKASWLCRWVHEYIPYCSHINSQGMSPLKLVYERVGICSDFVMLFLGLCSSAGIKGLYDICGYAQNKGLTPELHEWTCLYCPQCKQMVAFDPTWNLCYGLPPSHLAIRTKNRIKESTYNIKPEYSITYVNNNKTEHYVDNLDNLNR